MKLAIIILFSFLITIGKKSNVNGLCNKLIDTISQKSIVIDKKDYVLYDKNNVNKIKFDSTLKRRIYISQKAFIEEASIYYKGYACKVISHFIQDSVDSTEPNLFNPICTKQQIFFYYNRKLIKAVTYPVKTIYQKVSNNKRMLMLEDVINYLGIIKSRSGLFVVINGWGGCNTCSYYEGLYSIDGKSIASIYGTNTKTIKKTGDIFAAIKRLRINSKEYNQQLYSMIKVYRYPDQQ